MPSSHFRYYVLPRWTQEELKKVIAMLHNPEFDSKDIDPDLHKRMDKAVQDGRIKCFNMRESDADGDQDLHLWAREIEDVVLEIMEDPVFRNLPDKTGEKAKWNFEKAHSILHKVREIVLWGNSDNTSYQAPEVRTNMYVHV